MSLKHTFIFVLVFLSSGLLLGQGNLVTNGGFEGYPLLPDTSINGRMRDNIKWYRTSHPGVSSDQVSSALGIFSLDIPVNSYSQGKAGDYLVDGWFQATDGTTDFWNSNDCSVGNYKLPGSPRHGGKIGMVLNIAPEYIETKLDEPLEAGMSYYLEFFIHPPAGANWQALTTFGALFTSEKIITSNTDYIKALPQVLVCDTVVLNNSHNWQKISGCFTAKGGEQYLTIGCFDFYEAMGIRKKFEPFYAKQAMGKSMHEPKLSDGSKRWWYYLVDDVMLTEDEDCEHFIQEHESMTLLIDVSASMYRGKYMDALKDDIETYISGAGKNTDISVLSFAADVKTLVNHAKLNDPNRLASVLDSLVPGGKTNIMNGIVKAFKTAKEVKDTTIENRVILLTDADFELDETTIAVIKEAYEHRNITLSVFHYGTKPNDKLDKLLVKNGGEYHSSSTESLQELLIHEVVCPCRLK